MPRVTFSKSDIFKAARGEIVPGLRDYLDIGPKALPSQPLNTTWPAFNQARQDGYLLQRGLNDDMCLGRIWVAWCRVQRLPVVEITAYGMRRSVRVQVWPNSPELVFTAWGIRTLAEAWRRVDAGGTRWNFAPNHVWIEDLLEDQAEDLARMWLKTASDPRAIERKDLAQERGEFPALSPVESILRPEVFTPLGSGLRAEDIGEE